jgi:phospholipase C
MAYALNLTDAPRTDAPALTVSPGPFGLACSNTPSTGTGIGTVDKSQVNKAAEGASQTPTPGGRFADLRVKASALGFPSF